MPVYQFASPAVDDLPLPSDPTCVVQMKREASQGDVNAANKAMLAITADATGVDLGEVDMGAFTNAALCRLIVSWNLLDGDGVMVPVTPENLDRLTQKDGAFLTAEAMKRIGGRPAVLQGPFGTPSPTSSLPTETTSPASEQIQTPSES